MYYSTVRHLQQEVYNSKYCIGLYIKQYTVANTETSFTKKFKSFMHWVLLMVICIHNDIKSIFFGMKCCQKKRERKRRKTIIKDARQLRLIKECSIFSSTSPTSFSPLWMGLIQRYGRRGDGGKTQQQQQQKKAEKEKVANETRGTFTYLSSLSISNEGKNRENEET